MRNAFAEEITKLAAENEKVILLSGDIGNRLFNNYKEIAADRFFNCGVAEANMTGVAAGMALSGLKPVTYTITPFNTLRCLEQIKLDVCYHNLSVVIVGTGSGLSYANLGPTHHSCDDIACMRALPNMTVVCPGDAWEVRAGLRAALDFDGPVFLRIGKKKEPLVHESMPKMKIGEAMVMRPGEQVCLINTGNTLPLTIAATEKLSEIGVSTMLVHMHTVKPLDAKLLREICAKFAFVATVEEHCLTGGLGAAVAEWMIDRCPSRPTLRRFALPDEFLSECGPQDSAREKYGLTVENIVETIKSNFARI